MERPQKDLSAEELDAMFYGGSTNLTNQYDSGLLWRVEESTGLDEIVRLVKDDEETPIVLVHRKGWNAQTPGVSVLREVNGHNDTDKRLEVALPGYAFDKAVQFAVSQVVESVKRT